MINNFALLGLVGAAGLALFIVLLAILAFEIWMFVSAIQNQNITSNAKVLWIVGMLLLHPFVAIAYYFTDHQKTA